MKKLAVYNQDDYLMISGIQHFSFCRRQWALIHIEEKWSENHLTAQGRVIHSRVHDLDIVDYRNGIITYRDMAVKSAELGITGNCDAVEFVPSDSGIELFSKQGLWSVQPVEYKRGSTKSNDCDRLQVVAQALCLEEMFCCSIDVGYIFYHETRRREKVEISQEIREKVKSMFAEMHDYYNRGYTPKVRKGKKCRNCSLEDDCLPGLPRRLTVENYLNAAYEDKQT